MFKTFFLKLFVFGLFALPVNHVLAAEREILVPFDHISPNRSYAPTPLGGFACAAPPKAVRNLEFESVYTDKSDGVSIVDDAAKEQYKEDTANLRAFENNLSMWTALYMANPEANLVYAECVVDWLNTWAEGEALLGKANPQGHAVRKWSLATFSSLFLQISDDARLSGQKTRLIKGWLNLVAQNVRNYYTRNPEFTTRQNNHMFWAAWSVMITGVLMDDHDMFGWGVDRFKFAADQIQADGTLPHEMDRMGKAFNYHIFAVGPLVLMAETAEKNNIRLYDYNDHALKRLVDRILTEMETDQKYITEKTGREQNLDGTLTAGQLAWMEPYYARFKEPRMARWLTSMRPMDQRRLGGNLTQLFAVE